jgi:hypothetical protein
MQAISWLATLVLPLALADQMELYDSVTGAPLP